MAWTAVTFVNDASRRLGLDPGSADATVRIPRGHEWGVACVVATTTVSLFVFCVCCT